MAYPSPITGQAADSQYPVHVSTCDTASGVTKIDVPSKIADHGGEHSDSKTLSEFEMAATTDTATSHSPNLVSDIDFPDNNSSDEKDSHICYSGYGSLYEERSSDESDSEEHHDALMKQWLLDQKTRQHTDRNEETASPVTVNKEPLPRKSTEPNSLDEKPIYLLPENSKTHKKLFNIIKSSKNRDAFFSNNLKLNAELANNEDGFIGYLEHIGVFSCSQSGCGFLSNFISRIEAHGYFYNELMKKNISPAFYKETEFTAEKQPLIHKYSNLNQIPLVWQVQSDFKEELGGAFDKSINHHYEIYVLGKLSSS
ncbi:hypothetical protein [Endozoicomonas sp.]|uniref:hypothetical protein n=1 Tax=Endozoicomonas sp. TaxID=1892382 RepID=UPI003839D8A4